MGGSKADLGTLRGSETSSLHAILPCTEKWDDCFKKSLRMAYHGTVAQYCSNNNDKPVPCRVCYSWKL